MPTPPPTLQPPGAGLPWWEHLAAKYVVFPHHCRHLDWASAARLFQSEGASVLALWDATPAERLGEPVLIRRLQGMEDSSRYWSVAMTVEHLNIVGTGVRRLIGALRQGQEPDRQARIEDVKPTGKLPPAEVRAAFVHLLADAADDDPPLARGEGPRAAHPWFGPIDAFRWHCLLGIHQRIHRKQIEAIRVQQR